MKRFLLLSLALLLSLSLLACRSRDDQPGSNTDPSSQTTTAPDSSVPPLTHPDGVFVFPKDTTLFQVKLDGMSVEQALEALKKATGSYKLTASIGEDTASLSGKDLKLSLNTEAFDAWAAALESGKKADPSDLFQFAPVDEIAAYLSKQLSREARNATVAYSEQKGKFVPTDGVEGHSLDAKKVEPVLKKALLAGDPQLKLDSLAVIKAPTVTLQEPRLKTAAEQANAYLDLSLTYTYSPDGADSSERAISKAELASFLAVDKDFSVSIDQSAIENYVSIMSDTYSTSGRQGSFQATNGYSVGLTVEYYGQTINQSAMAEDIRSCLENGTSGVRKAPYHTAGSYNQMAYGGNYVEIDLSAQHLWVYRDGEAVVSSPIVSGCVAEDFRTPNGVFSVEDRDTDCSLVGDTYETHVDYWIGFYGGYGMHDAPWRWAFGDDIYLYDGSHGCANLPPYQASLVYDNTTLGMKVIVHGGASEVDPLEQEIICQTEFDVADDAKPFRLDAELKYEDSDVSISYKSSDPDVATVSQDGKVTVKGVGSTTITLTSPSFTYHTAGKLKVTVNVHSACEEGRHHFGDWTVSKKATCLPGEETRTCSRCDKTETRQIPANDKHSWGKWTVTEEATCKDGKESRTCSICGKSESRKIPATGKHAWGKWTVTEEATCKDGKESRTCSICGESESRTIPATGKHVWSEWTVTKAPSCLPGEESRTCSICGKSETKEIDATGEHTPGEWETVTAPGCETPGLKRTTCTVCGQELTEEIPPLGHDFVPEEPLCRRGCGTANPDYVEPSLPDALARRIRCWLLRR